MKRVILIILIILLFGCAAADINNGSNQSSDFQWYTYQPDGYTLYSDSSSSGTSIMVHQSVQLPFFEASSPASKMLFSLNADDIDMWPGDGWVLIQKQFGTITKAPSMPYFILYNKYRGVLRFFFYNARITSDFSYAIVKITHSGTPTANLVFEDPKYCTLQDYNAEKSLVGVCEIIPRSWSFVDFTLGYDPNVATMNDAMYWFTIIGVHESAITLDGTMTLNQTLEDGSLTASGSSFGLDEGVKAIKAAGKTYKSISKLVGKLQQKAAEEPSEWFAGVPNGTSSLLNLLPYAGAAGSAISTIIGILNPTKPVMMHFKGEISLSGTIQEENPTFTCGLAVPGMAQVSNTGNQSSEYFPMYNQSLGSFSVNTIPVMNISNYNERHCDYAWSYDYVKTVISTIGLDITINPNIEASQIITSYYLVWDVSAISAYNTKYDMNSYWTKDGSDQTSTNRIIIYDGFAPNSDRYVNGPLKTVIFPMSVITNKPQYKNEVPLSSHIQLDLNNLFVRSSYTCNNSITCDCPNSDRTPNTRWVKNPFTISENGEKDPSQEANIFLPDLMIKVIILPPGCNSATDDNAVYIYKRITPKYNLLN